MTGYIVLGLFVFIVFLAFIFFMIGLNHGKKLAEADYNEELAIKEKNARDYEKAKKEIKQEVLKNAERKKAELSGNVNAVDRFNAINKCLSGRSKNEN
jgi:hypothetical protein